MPELDVTIGGRVFQVACQPGEEHYLRAAAAMLDAEAAPVVAQMGRIPESRMLLMAGLMLADKTAGQEDELRLLRARITELEAQGTPAPQRIEVPVIPPQVGETLADLAARAEALANRLEEDLV
ncbi:cell division protein ZapA [Gemmobacter serpentinus]|uniref:cell division protein ZapA n=1 Tax=Gemmobacter serpentinus TaxID=2652247 RepID=UPI00124C2D29|nr:cell division protein ZapA [Gemmobacter serpentinus]